MAGSLNLAPEFWGQGHGTEASRLVTDYGFRERGLHHVCAETMPRTKPRRPSGSASAIDTRRRSKKRRFWTVSASR